VDRARVGNTYRAIRVELGLRQADVAVRAGLSQQAVSRLECGRFGGLSVDAFCRIADALGADVALAPRWRGARLDRLLDRRHALLQNRVVEALAQLGWEVRTEQSFNHFGDRGAVDVVGWRPGQRALLVVEVKSEIASLEETLRRLDVKARLYRQIGRPHGWLPRFCGAVLVLPNGTAHRSIVRRHAALVSAALPARGVAVRRWLSQPAGDLRGVWFVRNTTGVSVTRRVDSARRARAGRSGRPRSGLRAIHAGLSVAREKRPSSGGRDGRGPSHGGA
jgi:transcriptional regulator with XRE-family HTH domain